MMNPNNKRRILVITERNEFTFTPCGWIRLVHPLLKLDAEHNLDIRFGNFEDIYHWTPSLIFSQRGVLSLDQIREIQKLKLRSGIAFIYDLDDDLLHVQKTHVDSAHYSLMRRQVEESIRVSDITMVSTEALAKSVRRRNLIDSQDIKVVYNQLDSLWITQKENRIVKSQIYPSIVYMGSPSHSKDWQLVEKSIQVWLSKNQKAHLTVIGIPPKLITATSQISVISPPLCATASYPAFTTWYRNLPNFNIGLNPLQSNPINLSKSCIKILQYASQGTLAISSLNGDISRIANDIQLLEVSLKAAEWIDALDKAANELLESNVSEQLVNMAAKRYSLETNSETISSFDEIVKYCFEKLN